MTEPNNGIVLYHYSFSPYAKRVLWYLTFRGLDFAECKQPPVMPRPDVQAIALKYRRIPIMAIGKDVYCDTRLILRKLEKVFPEGALGASNPDQKGLEKLLESWTIDGGVFFRASQLIPTSMPLLNDPTFTKDREDFSGRSWDKAQIAANRPEALAYMRQYFNLLETTLLADGREWVLSTEKPTLADIEAVWVVDWMKGLKDALPKELISEKQFPKVFAYIERFNKALKEAKAKAPKPVSLKGDAAATRILDAQQKERQLQVDPQDPTALKQGDEVDVWPIDSGFSRRDSGPLIGLTEDEIVLAGASAIQLHFPRLGFRIRKAVRPNTAPKL